MTLAEIMDAMKRIERMNDPYMANAELEYLREAYAEYMMEVRK